MLHLNHNLLAALDLETTGADPKQHEIWQIGILILDRGLRPHPDLLPFDVVIRPEFPERADRSVMRINKDAWNLLLKHKMDHERAREIFFQWLQHLTHRGALATNRKLCPLSQNWPGIDRPFLTEWLGPETFFDIFHPWYRDPIPVAQFVNDVNYHNPQSFNPSRAIFPKANLASLGGTLNVPNDSPHKAIADAAQMAEVYRQMVIGFANGPNGMVKPIAGDRLV